MGEFVHAITETVNPKGGGGVRETALFALILVLAVVLEVTGTGISAEMYAIFGSVLGYLVGGNRKRESKQKEEKRKAG